MLLNAKGSADIFLFKSKISYLSVLTDVGQAFPEVKTE